MIGAAVTAAVILLVASLISIRFIRSIRRSLREPRFKGLLVMVCVTLAAGTLFYWRVEGWSLLDAFYFSSITLTTVGYGDLTPQTGAGKVFTVFYVFTGLGIILAFVNAVAKASFERRQERKGVPEHPEIQADEREGG